MYAIWMDIRGFIGQAPAIQNLYNGTQHALMVGFILWVRRSISLCTGFPVPLHENIDFFAKYKNYLAKICKNIGISDF